MQNIAAFTFKYDQLEDRLLLVGNLKSQESRIDFWLTRKLVLRLLNGVQELVDKTAASIQQVPKEHKSQLAQFHHDQAKSNLSIEREDQKLVPDAPRLLTRIDISYNHEQYQLTFFSTEPDPLAVSVLTYDELHQILHLIHKGALSLEWGASPNLFESDFSQSTLQ